MIAHQTPYKILKCLQNVPRFQTNTSLSFTTSDVTSETNATTVPISVKTVLNSIKLFVNEYALGGKQNNTGWFWFIIFFIFCITMFCMLIRIQVRLDTIVESMFQTSKEIGTNTFRLIRQ